MKFAAVWGWAIFPVYLNVANCIMGEDYIWLPVLAILGLAAPICLWATEGLWHHRYYRLASISGIIGLAVLAINLLNAIGSAADHRQRRSQPAEDKIRHERLLRDDEADISQQIARLGWVTRGDDIIVIRRSVDLLRADPLFKRSGECADVTRSDSGTFCANYRNEEARLAAAVKIDDLGGKRQSIRTQLMKIDVPQAADIQVATLQRLLASFFHISDTMLAAGLAGILSAVAELIGSFMPVIMDKRLALALAGTSAGAVCQEVPKSFAEPMCHAVPDVPDVPDLSKEGLVKMWLSAKDVPDSAGRAGTTELTRDYNLWAMAHGYETFSINTMGTILIGLGYSKELTGKKRYIGLRVKSAKLEVVK